MEKFILSRIVKSKYYLHQAYDILDDIPVYKVDYHQLYCIAKIKLLINEADIHFQEIFNSVK